MYSRNSLELFADTILRITLQFAVFALGSAHMDSVLIGHPPINIERMRDFIARMLMHRRRWGARGLVQALHIST